jgi:RNase adapter protein RapZ
MLIKLISYGYKYYEAEGKEAPEHDFLFSLRDLINPFWIPDLKPLTGLDSRIIEFFERDLRTQRKLDSISDLCIEFIEDFISNESRKENDSLIFAFRCTGGKHRSVYFAETVYKRVLAQFNKSKLVGRDLEIKIEHVDLPRHSPALV